MNIKSFCMKAADIRSKATYKNQYNDKFVLGADFVLNLYFDTDFWKAEIFNLLNGDIYYLGTQFFPKEVKFYLLKTNQDGETYLLEEKIFKRFFKMSIDKLLRLCYNKTI